ncbi:hypothetical protein CYANOKiyG1_66780 [Okeania sp. KiyG1]|nr:hypothetical protein CYANOKiyG1_66780 [Okeania sp. KiyG1]
MAFAPIQIACCLRNYVSPIKVMNELNLSFESSDNERSLEDIVWTIEMSQGRSGRVKQELGNIRKYSSFQ